MTAHLIKITFVVTLVAVLTGCVIHVGGNKNGQRANVQLSETLELDASALTAFDVEAGAGDLSIVGIEGQQKIQVLAKIFTTKDRNYQLTLKQVGNRAQLVAKHNNTWGSWTGSSPRIHLTITMPPSLALDITDGSGDITVSNVNNGLVLDDGSGNILLKHIANAVTVDDGSGNIVANYINGDIQLDDGSGEIELNQVNGNVNIEDGSGNLYVTQTSGVVTVDDGSGNIDINIAGGINIIESGSGGLSVSGVKGGVVIDD